MAVLRKGIVQIYTGDGKGKTTAALGLAWRMLGAGGRVYMCQFLKPSDSVTGEAVLAGEISDKLVFEQVDCPWNMRTADCDPVQLQQGQAAVAEKLQQIAEIASEGQFDLIILDEIVFCLSKKVARLEDVCRVIEQRAGHVELVLTGRGADEELICRAELVTNMEEVKHPYKNGTAARLGIEY